MATLYKTLSPSTPVSIDRPPPLPPVRINRSLVWRVTLKFPALSRATNAKLELLVKRAFHACQFQGGAYRAR